MERPLRRVDVLRHELKALRYILDSFHTSGFSREELPAPGDFQSEQARTIYGVIVSAPSRERAEQAIGRLDLADVDIGSFLSLGGRHYHSYMALVRQRAAEIRAGKLQVEAD